MIIQILKKMYNVSPFSPPFFIKSSIYKIKLVEAGRDDNLEFVILALESYCL